MKGRVRDKAMMALQLWHMVHSLDQSDRAFLYQGRKLGRIDAGLVHQTAGSQFFQWHVFPLILLRS